MAKRGIIISYYFPPTGGGGVQRWIKLIKYLHPLGWDFTVITSEYNSDNPKDSSLLDEIPPTTKIIRTPTAQNREGLKSKIPFLQKSGYWQRWLSAFFHVTDSREYWNFQSKNYLIKELDQNNYELVVFTSPPYSMALLAAELTDLITVPVVLDLRDPWTINPYKIHPTIIHRFLDRRRETRAIGKVQYLVSAYNSTLEDYARRITNFEKTPLQNYKSVV